MVGCTFILGDSEVQCTMPELALLNQLDGFEATQSIKVVMHRYLGHCSSSTGKNR